MPGLSRNRSRSSICRASTSIRRARTARDSLAASPPFPYYHFVSLAGPSMSPRRGILVLGALLTVLAAVTFDLVAGEAPLHAATIGLITSAAVILRVHLTGRHRSLLQFLCACIVAQPSIHFAIKELPHANYAHGAGAIPGPAELIATTLHISLILAIVAIVTFIEEILSAVAIGIALIYIIFVRSVRELEPDKFSVRTAPACGLLISRYRAAAISRRGPPFCAIIAS